MDPKRADPLDIDLSGFGPAPPAKPKVETAAVRQVSEANDFLSRAPARKPKVQIPANRGQSFRRIADSNPGNGIFAQSLVELWNRQDRATAMPIGIDRGSGLIRGRAYLAAHTYMR